MGKIDIRSGSKHRVFASADAPLLRQAICDPAHAGSAIGVEIEFFAFEREKPHSLGMAGAALAPGDFMIRLHQAAGPDAELVSDPKNHYPCGLALPSGGRFCLENGGQIEYASSPAADLSAVAAELEAALALCERAGAGAIGFLSHGTHPTLEPRLDPLVPNSRYRVMERFFAPDSIHRWGNYASAIQVNMDIPEPADWQEATRLAFVLARFGYFLFANAAYLHGRPAPRARLGLCRQMDARRREVPAAVIQAPDMAAAYVDWALDASVIFAGDGPLETMPRRGELTFRDWIEEGFRDHYPTYDDWLLHLGTLWPDVRPRRFIELRTADAQPFGLTMAVVAFWAALLQRRAGRAALRGFLDALPGGTEALVARGMGDALFEDPALHGALLDLAAGVLAAEGEARWAEAVAAYAGFLPHKAAYWRSEGAAGFVEKALSFSPAAELAACRPPLPW